MQNVDDLPERGKTRATTLREDKAVIKLIEANSQLTLRQAQKELLKKKIKVNPRHISVWSGAT